MIGTGGGESLNSPLLCTVHLFRFPGGYVCMYVCMMGGEERKTKECILDVASYR